MIGKFGHEFGSLDSYAKNTVLRFLFMFRHTEVEVIPSKAGLTF